jgi:uroporphyrinogen-III synthase
MEMTVLLIRANRNDVDARALSDLGIPSVIDPYLSITAVDNVAGVDRLRQALTATTKTWLIVTSTNVLPFLDRAMRPGELDHIISSNPTLKFAAIGAQTERELLDRGARAVLRPRGANSRALAIELCATDPCVAVIPSGSIAMKGLRNQLRESGFKVVTEVVYATTAITTIPESVARVGAGEFSGVLLRSPSAARVFSHFNPGTSIEVFCAGQTTGDEAVSLGLNVAGVSNEPSPEKIARMIAQHETGES